MKIHDLRTLFVDELKDAYDFEHQLIDALPKMVDSAHDPELKKAFREHLTQTRSQVRQLEKVFHGLGEKPARKTCAGMKGLLKEGKKVLRARGEEAAIDAALVGAAQRVEHYEMAAYGTLRSYARTLGRRDEEKILQQILDQEAKADERLTKIAESGVNARAANGLSRVAPDRPRAHRASGGADGVSKEALYQEARRLGIEGRSSMTKQELERALSRR